MERSVILKGNMGSNEAPNIKSFQQLRFSVVKCVNSSRHYFQEENPIVLYLFSGLSASTLRLVWVLDVT